MTSVLRSISQKKDALTRFVKIESVSFSDPGKGDILFPFKYTNGVLDISYDGNNFKSIMVDTLNSAPSDSETDVAYRLMGGLYLVTSLGSNFKEYVRAWRDGTIDVDSPIEVHLPSQITRVQEADNRHLEDDVDSYLISVNPPSDDNYITGDATNDFNTTFVFKTPLTFTIVESGVKKFITFRSMFDQE